jgi:hypothetical protein
MNRRTMMLSLLVGIGALAGMGMTPPAQAAPIVAQVGGGGVAVFDAPDAAQYLGMTTPFGLGVTIRSDGSATGHWECVITGVLANSVQVTSGSLNGDGSVTFSGPGTVHFAGGGVFLCPLETLTITAGGPGVGTFCLAPPSPGDTLCDHETVVNGNISIKTP